DPRYPGARLIGRVENRAELEGVVLGPPTRGGLPGARAAVPGGAVLSGGVHRQDGAALPPGAAPPHGAALPHRAAVGVAAKVGTGGMVTKVDAALIATEAGIPTVVAGADRAAAALAGEPVGTYFAPHDRRPAARQLWLAHAAAARGRLLLGGGAGEALVGARAPPPPAARTPPDAPAHP